MCGRIALYSEPDFLARVFDAQLGARTSSPTPGRAGTSGRCARSWPSPMCRTAGRAGGACGLRTRERPVHRELGRYQWGLVPSWAKDPSMGNRTFNARAETVASKPSFRAAFTARRLAVVADGFYEWKPGPGTGKQPYYFTRADGRPLALAGLWEQWWGGPAAPGARGGDGAPPPALRTCTVITTEAGRTWGTSTTGCRSCSSPRCSTSGWTRPTGTSRSSSRCSCRRRRAPWSTGRSAGRSGNVRNDGPELIEALDGVSGTERDLTRTRRTTAPDATGPAWGGIGAPRELSVHSRRLVSVPDGAGLRRRRPPWRPAS